LELAFISGFFLSLSLIVAIGPQNAFVLRQGLLRQHVFSIAVFCAVSDIILINLGVFGFGSIISEIVWLSQYMFMIGGLWLAGYGFLRLKGAYIADSYLEATSEDVPDLKLALTNCAALTWLNPHVYIDTLLLIGTVSIRFDNNFQFSAGASAASLIFFFSLAFGARLLSPLMNSRKAWQTLDVLIAFVMFALSYSMFLEAL
jgi:L-lysine exporter family protein LysE/ArgO